MARCPSMKCNRKWKGSCRRCNISTQPHCHKFDFRHIHGARLGNVGCSAVLDARPNCSLWYPKCCRSVVIYLWAFRLWSGKLTPNCLISRFDFLNDNPSQVTHSLALDFSHRFGNFLDELFLQEYSLNGLYSGEWYSNFTSSSWIGLLSYDRTAVLLDYMYFRSFLLVKSV